MKHSITIAGVVGILVPMVALTATWPASSGTAISTSATLGSGYEPSGVVALEDGNLLVVGDDGDLTHMTDAGVVMDDWNPGGDLEGVAVTDNQTLAYLGVEHPDAIKEFNLETGALTGNQWSLTPWMTGATNQGLEALTWVPNGDHPYAEGSSGGLFYAGLQANGKVYVFDVDRTTSGSVSFVDSFSLGIGGDIAALHYEPDTGHLYAGFDSSNTLIVANTGGAVLASYTQPGNDQEGVTLVPDCESGIATVFIAEDVGPEVWSYPSFPVTCLEVEEEEETPQEEEPNEESTEEGSETPENEEPVEEQEPEPTPSPEQEESPVEENSEQPETAEEVEEAVTAEQPRADRPTQFRKKRLRKRTYRFRWNGDAEAYTIVLLDKNKKRVKRFKGITDTKKVIGKKYLKKGKTYFVRIRACNSGERCSKSRIRRLRVR